MQIDSKASSWCISVNLFPLFHTNWKLNSEDLQNRVPCLQILHFHVQNIEISIDIRVKSKAKKHLTMAQPQKHLILHFPWINSGVSFIKLSVPLKQSCLSKSCPQFGNQAFYKNCGAPAPCWRHHDDISRNFSYMYNLYLYNHIPETNASISIHYLSLFIFMSLQLVPFQYQTNLFHLLSSNIFYIFCSWLIMKAEWFHILRNGKLWHLHSVVMNMK